jgi:hypothetical protein
MGRAGGHPGLGGTAAHYNLGRADRRRGGAQQHDMRSMHQHDTEHAPALRLGLRESIQGKGERGEQKLHP